MKSIFRPPLLLDAARWMQAVLLEWRHRKRHLRIGVRSYAIGCTFGQFVTIYNNVALQRVTLGDYSYIANDVSITQTTIGKFVSIGPGVRCGLGIHPTETFVSTHPAFFSIKRQAQITFTSTTEFVEQRPIAIGNDVWIGANAIILDGVQISDGAIIAAGAVVTKDVPPYAIVGGIPAKLIRLRFSEEQIQQLLSLRWWDKDERWLKIHAGQFRNVTQLLKQNDAD